MMKTPISGSLRKAMRGIPAKDHQLQFVYCGDLRFRHAVQAEDGYDFPLSAAISHLRAYKGLPLNESLTTSVEDRFSLSPGEESLAAYALKKGYWR